MTTYGSLFSGVGGFDLGCDAAGWDCRWQVEWDAKARSVLERHWPGVDRYEDVRDVAGDELAPVDVITFGFPCQDLSVAGKRAGLEGGRSGLFFEAIRIIREMREATNGTYPRVAVAENVVGLLNADKGDAMGRCLDALAEVGALAVEWRILDAQFFGVPQRRRRVFLVAVFDSRAAGRGQVFPEPSSVRRDSATVGKTGQEVAGTLGGGTPGGGSRPDTDRMTFVVTHRAFVKAARSTSNCTPESWKENGPAPTLNLFDNTGDGRATVIAVPERMGTLTTAFGPKNYTNLQEVLNGSVFQHKNGMPRRLTPLECERLMGWPDGHTQLSANGNTIADSQRYQMCGNGVATPVAQYVAACVEDVINES